MAPQDIDKMLPLQLDFIRAEGRDMPDLDSLLEALVTKHLGHLSLRQLPQQAIPRLAKDSQALRAINKAIKEVPTRHDLWLGDARTMSQIPSESVHLVVTSPPYFDLKKYPEHHAQLGALHDYELFLKELDQVWVECFRVLVKGGRLIVVVGDV